jgi:hypothetical protein
MTHVTGSQGRSAVTESSSRIDGEIVVPLVLRGRIVTDELVSSMVRGDDATLRCPDPHMYVREMVLADPLAMRDVHTLRTDEVLDFLAELGRRLDPERNAHIRAARELSYAAAPTTAPIVDEMYRILPMIFDRARLEDMLDCGIDRAALDGWMPTVTRDGRTLEVRAFGARAVHVTAGNSPVLAALAVIRNALTRGDALIKSPSNDPLTAPAIAQTMCEIDDRHPLTRHLAVAYGAEATRTSRPRSTSRRMWRRSSRGAGLRRSSMSRATSSPGSS